MKESDSDIDKLDARITELLDICNSLNNAKQLLIQENTQLKQERDALRSKTSMVQDRVRSMIDEIKSLEARV